MRDTFRGLTATSKYRLHAFCGSNLFFRSTSSHLIGLYKSPQWEDGLHLWSNCQVTFDTTLMGSNMRSIQNLNKENGHSSLFLFVSWCFSVSRSIRCLKIGICVFSEGLSYLLTLNTAISPPFTLFYVDMRCYFHKLGLFSVNHNNDSFSIEISSKGITQAA